MRTVAVHTREAGTPKGSFPPNRSENRRRPLAQVDNNYCDCVYSKLPVHGDNDFLL